MKWPVEGCGEMMDGRGLARGGGEIRGWRWREKGKERRLERTDWRDFRFIGLVSGLDDFEFQ